MREICRLDVRISETNHKLHSDNLKYLSKIEALMELLKLKLDIMEETLKNRKN